MSTKILWEAKVLCAVSLFKYCHFATHKITFTPRHRVTNFANDAITVTVQTTVSAITSIHCSILALVEFQTV